MVTAIEQLVNTRQVFVDKQPTEQNCPECNGYGYNAECCGNSEDGVMCCNYPIQVQCHTCQSTGKILTQNIMKTTIPTQDQNTKGLHQRFYLQKIVGSKAKEDFFGNTYYEPVLQEVDHNAEYFTLRLDMGGSDINHIKACRIGIHAYADAIEPTIPGLAKDLRERYPLLP